MTTNTDHQSPKELLRELSKVKGSTVSSLVTLALPVSYSCL